MEENIGRGKVTNDEFAARRPRPLYLCWWEARAGPQKVCINMLAALLLDFHVTLPLVLGRLADLSSISRFSANPRLSGH